MKHMTAPCKHLLGHADSQTTAGEYDLNNSCDSWLSWFFKRHLTLHPITKRLEQRRIDGTMPKGGESLCATHSQDICEKLAAVSS